MARLLSRGLYTEVGDRGNLLSVGQRQLVSLVRGLVQKPAILILDEATSSVYPFTEGQIQQALNMVLEQATSILIAPRLSTVKASDRIIVLCEGEIIEDGDHDQLMAAGGHYAEFYNTFFLHRRAAASRAGNMKSCWKLWKPGCSPTPMSASGVKVSKSSE